MTTSGTTTRRPATEPLRAQDLICPWSVVEVSVYPFGPTFYPFNPSIHLDPATGSWRCLVRCADYSLPRGTVIQPLAGRAQTRNVLLDLEPDTLRPASLSEVLEVQDLPRAPGCPSLGLEDLRLFQTTRDGIIAVGCSLQHNLEHPGRPEVVLCWFDDAWRVTAVRPLRGPWGFRPQKNWVPFDGADEVRLLYSVERGVIMDEDGPVPGSPAPASPPVTQPTHVDVPQTRGSEVRLRGPTVVVPDPVRRAGARLHEEMPGELRGGSQLVAASGDLWIGVAHEVVFSYRGTSKFYWHTLYAVDPSGRLVARSPPVRLSGDHGIEFVAGIALDRATGRLAISYGTDDHQAWIATTTLDAFLAILQPVD